MRRLLPPLVLALVLVSPAAAAKFSFAVLTSSPLSAPGVTLNGDDQTKTFTIDTEISSTNGNSGGWKVQASATAPASGSYSLPALVVTGGSMSCISGCTVNPQSSVSFPVTMSGSAQTIYNAAANTGTGDFDIASTFRLSVPAKTIAGTYSSTVTLSGSTGP